MKKLPPLRNTAERKETEVFSVAKINTLSQNVIRAVMPQGNRRMEGVVTA